MHTTLAPLLIAACALAFAAQDAPPAPPKAAKATVTGKVLFDGVRADPKPLPATPAQTKGCCPEGKTVNVADPRLVIDAKSGIQNVLVTIEVPNAKAVVPPAPYVVDQRSCVFEPHCTLVQAGAKVVFKNSDNVSHNVHVYAARNDGSNDTIPAGAEKEYVFAHADKITILCDYHPWMSSMLLVVDTPFAALTGRDGSFAIQGLEPGTYKVKLWHEVLGRAESQVVIQPDGTSAPLEIKLSEPRKR